MSREKFDFWVSTVVKSKEGEVMELAKVERWEIDLEKEQQDPKEVVFNKDGKEYKIVVKDLELVKGKWKKWVRRFTWKTPPNAGYDFQHDPNKPEQNEKHYIRFVSPLNKGRIFAASLFLILTIVITFYLVRKKSRSKF